MSEQLERRVGPALDPCKTAIAAILGGRYEFSAYFPAGYSAARSQVARVAA